MALFAISQRRKEDLLIPGLAAQSFDESADLTMLSRVPITVVSATG